MIMSMDKFEQITKLAQAYSLITEVINGREEYDDIAAELQDVANTVADISDEIEGIEIE
jgi:uncharacterized LabA/DUF88 family protein